MGNWDGENRDGENRDGADSLTQIVWLTPLRSQPCSDRGTRHAMP
jgi:hypothetical protein